MWKIHDSYSRHSIMDMDGDGAVDFVDTENESTSTTDTWKDGDQLSWRIYLGE